MMLKPVEETIAPKTVEFTPPVDIARLESNRESNRAANDDRNNKSANVRQPRPMQRRLLALYERAKQRITAR